MKSRLLPILVALMLVLCSTAWAEPLRIGILPVLDTLPLQVAVQDGLFAEAGVEVELVPFTSALERDTAMQSGQLNGYFGDLLATLLLIQNDVHMRIATVSYSTTPGQPMFAIVGAPGHEMRDDVLVGISRSTIIEYLLDAMRATGDLEDINFEVTEIKKIPIRMQMLLSDQIQAAVLPEPLVSLAVGKGASVLLTDEGLDMPLTVVCLHQDVLDQVPAFLEAYGKAVEAINTHPEDYRQLMAETCRIPPEMAADFPIYTYPAPSLPSEESVDQVQQWMLEKVMLDRRLDYASIIAE